MRHQFNPCWIGRLRMRARVILGQGNAGFRRLVHSRYLRQDCHPKDHLMHEYRNLVDTPASPSPAPMPKKKKIESTADQFVEVGVAFNVKLPADLVKAVKLNAINEGFSSGQYIVSCLTSRKMCEKAWISTRKAG